MQKTFIEQTLFLVGTFVTCISILFASNLKSNAGLGAKAAWLTIFVEQAIAPAGSASVAIKTSDSGPVAEIQLPPNPPATVCEDPVAKELSNGYQTPSFQHEAREILETATFESAIRIQSSLDKILSRPAVSEQSCEDSQAVEISIDISPSILSLASN